MPKGRFSWDFCAPPGHESCSMVTWLLGGCERVSIRKKHKKTPTRSSSAKSNRSQSLLQVVMIHTDPRIHVDPQGSRGQEQPHSPAVPSPGSPALPPSQ